MDSICRFVPIKTGNGDIQTVHFVYETELAKLKQPFVRPVNYVNLVVKGCGTLKYNNCDYELSEGTLFFMFPQIAYYIEASDDFEYIYISYTGTCASNLMDSFGITPTNAVYHNFTHAPLWSDAISRITAKNANILTESVLYYTLALIQSENNTCNQSDNDDDIMSQIKSYIDIHYREQDISLGKLSQIFSYSEKYLSASFNKNMNMHYAEYINKLRIQYATALMADGNNSISRISGMCGYSDPLYFSKVFKKLMGCTPTDYIKKA